MKHILIILAAGGTLMLSGCAKKVSQTTLRTDTLRLTREIVRTDTLRLTDREFLFCYDSIAPMVDSAGRVTGYDRHHYRYVDRSREAESRHTEQTADSLQHKTQTEVRTETAKPLKHKELSDWLKAAALLIAGWLFANVFRSISKKICRGR